MSSASLNFTRSSAVTGMLGDYLELAKPRIAVLVLVTVGAAGYVAAWGQPNPWMILHAMVGVFLIAASASAVNQWIEKDSDALMRRTKDRPLPSGRLGVFSVLSFALVTVVAGLAYLGLTTSWQTASWGALTWVLYTLVYTPLKPRTSLNTLVGAIAGAMPVVIGWSAVGGVMNPLVDPRLASIYLLVVVWQFPHFMAIAWLYREDYAAAGLKMLTVVDPSGRRAGVQAVLCALALLPISFVPAIAAPSSMYIIIAFCLGFAQFLFAVRFLMRLDTGSARGLLRASLVYLPAMLLLLMLLPLL